MRGGRVLGTSIAATVLMATLTVAAHGGPVTLTLVVSATGLGDACTSAAPCALLTAKAHAQNAREDVDVVLDDGTYELGAPLQFTAADGGHDGHHVIYEAAPGGHPVLSGGIAVSGWTVHDGVWSASVPAGTQSREFYVNGVRIPRTTESPPGAWVQTSTGYLTTNTDILRWRNPSSIELVFSEGNGFWTEPRCDIASVRPAAIGASVTVRQPCWSNLHIPDTPAALGDPAHANGDNAMGGFEGLTAVSPPSSIENVYELLSPGHWYLDEPTHTVYYDPQPGQTPSAVSAVLPVLPAILTGAGTLDDPITNLELRGLTFAYTTWPQPSSNDGFAEMQANVTLTGVNASGSDPGSGRAPQGTCQYSIPAGSCPFGAWTRAPASVMFDAARNVVVDHDVFTHLGAAGLGFADGSRDNLIQGNEITDTSGSGIQLGDTTDAMPADRREINDGNTIADNWIHNVAAEYHGGVGIWVGYTRHTLIAHNEVAHTPYTAISFGWGGWHTDTLHPDNPSIAASNTIEDNLIYDYLTTLPDGGAIYTNGTQGPGPILSAHATPEQMRAGLLIKGNVALIATWSEFAYYNDEGSDYITYDTNAEYQAHLFAHGGCDTVGHLLIADNYWAQPTGGYICPPPPVDINIVDHHILPDHPGPGDLPVALRQAAGLEPAFRGLVTAHPPEVTGVGPQAGPGPVLISGSGFTPDTAVRFGSMPATAVKVLSANYLVATPPTTIGVVDVTVRTPAGTSAVSGADQFVLVK